MGLKTNLVSYWALEEASGNLLDSVGSNDLTNNGADYQATGKIDYGVNFVTGDYLEITGSSADVFDGDFSVSAWFKSDALQSGIIWMCGASGGSNENMVYFHTGSTANNCEAIVRDSAGNATSFTNITYTTGDWYHVVMIWDNTAKTFKFYKNNALHGTSGATANSRNTDSGTWRLGKFVGLNIHKFNGIIDEVGFWSRKLTGSEVEDLYNSGDGLSYNDFDATTITPSTLTLTTTIKDPAIWIQLFPTKGTVGTKDIDKNYPVTSGLGADDKHKGRTMNLVAQGINGIKSIVSKKNNKLL